VIGRILCFFGLHDVRLTTMSMEAYPKEFFYCVKCKAMFYHDIYERKEYGKRT